jgi:ABC-2 type transport system ATP-binding protein
MTALESTRTTPAGPDLLVIEKVSKRYSRRPFWRREAGSQEQVYALRDVSFTVRKGETIGLLGPNGAGKTTLLKIITSLIFPTTGRVLLEGHDIASDATRARRSMGLVTCDERSFYWRLTGRQNLSFFAALYGLPGGPAGRRIEELLEALGLADAGDRPYQGYSSGMKQKLAIARGLLANPRIVFYDEPTRSLDPLSTHSIRRWIIERRAASPGQSHVIATNQLAEAEELCDRVLIISRGTLLAEGSIDEIRRRYHPQDREVHRITWTGADRNGGLRPDPEGGIYEVQSEPPNELGRVLRVQTTRGGPGLTTALESILRSGGTVLGCETEQVSLDEVFRTVVLGKASGSSGVTEEADR